MTTHYSFPTIFKILFISLVSLLFLLIPFMTHAIERVSVSDAGVEAGNYSFWSSLSGDGRYVAFNSGATNLVPGDTNGIEDIFVYDRDTDTIERVSVSSAGVEGDDGSYIPEISGNGQFVLFISDATNLVPGDTNNSTDAFVYDRDTDTIERVSVDSLGNEIPSGVGQCLSISADGRYVTFDTDEPITPGDTNGFTDVFMYDRVTTNVQRLSVGSGGIEANAETGCGRLSDDGLFFPFDHSATNLVPGDTNGVVDIFVYDITLDTTERVSIDDLGNEANADSNEGPTISSNGRYVAFASEATNLVPSDTNGVTDIFVYDRDTDTIERVSVDSLGNEANGESYAAISLSSDGRYVTFVSSATNLVPGDTNGAEDMFIFDRDTDTIERVSVDNNGTEGDSDSGSDEKADLSSNGCYVSFYSDATNLVPTDTNGVPDIFVVPLCTITPTVTPLSTTSLTPTITGTWDNIDANELSITVDGTVYTLTSPELDTTTTPGTWSLDLSGAGLTAGTYEVLATNNNLFASEDDTTSNELVIASATPPSSGGGGGGGGGGSIKYICKDPDAINYNDSNFGRHRDSKCEYAEFACTDPEALNYDDSNDVEHKQSECEYNYSVEILTNLQEGSVQDNNISSVSNTCPIFTQYMKQGDKDGYPAQSKQNTGVSTTISQVKLLQQTLLEQGFNPGTIDGHYGPRTAQAVGQWQTKHFNQVLKPWNLTQSTSWFYQSSERWMNELLGCEDTVTLDTGVYLDERYQG